METVKQAVATIAKTEPDEEVRVVRRMEIGSAIQQGDVYLHRVGNEFPAGKLLKSRQIAEGTTIGARHVVEGDVDVYESVQLPPDVRAPEDAEDGAISGPVIDAHKSFRLTHPEHADHQCPPGRYAVTYQYDPRTMRRVVD